MFSIQTNVASNAGGSSEKNTPCMFKMKITVQHLIHEYIAWL